MDAELFGLALSDAVGDGWRVAVAAVPEEVALGGPLLLLPPARGSGGRGLTGLAQELAVHPVRIILELLAREQPIAGPYPPSWPTRCASGDAWASARLPRRPCPAWRSRTTPARAGATRARCCSGMLRMGKVGPGYHTEFDHFRRGAPAHEGRQALDVAEALLRAGLLGEKPSVGQRHIYLNVKALPEIHALIDRGETRDAVLERTWTAPPRVRRRLYGSSDGTVTVTTGTERSSVTRPAGGESPRAA